MLKRFTLLFFLYPGLLIPQETGMKVSDRLQQQIMRSEENSWFDISILLTDKVDVEALDRQFYQNRISIQERVATLIPLLKTRAEATQTPVLNYLQHRQGVFPSSIEPYWITNVIFATVKKDVILDLMKRKDVDFLDINAELFLDEATRESLPEGGRSAGGKEAGLSYIQAPQVWARGYTGYGRLAMGMDSGVNGEHPALRNQFRGNTHPLEQCWYIHGQGAAHPTDCGSDNHGTHTMGIMLGLDPATQDTIGVAFGAQWIGSPNLCSSNTSKSISTFQWALDPDQNNNTIDDMPDVINNSWYDSSVQDECNSLYKYVFDALEAAGIAIVFSAGNEGPDPSTITPPKNISTNEVNVFSVGNVSYSLFHFTIASSSSRGPSTCGGAGSLIIKPEVVAPGTGVRSSVGWDSYDYYSGTSMAAPHAAGAILLLKEAFPYLTGTELKYALYNTATDLGGTGEDNIYGMGLINVDAAFDYLVNQGNVPARYFNDVEAVQIIGIDDRTWGDTVTPGVIIRNHGENNLQYVQLTATWAGGVQTKSWTGDLATFEQDTVWFDPVSLAEGDYFLEVSLSDPNHVADERVFNDKVNKVFSVRYPAEPLSTNSCQGSPALLSVNRSVSGFAKWYDRDTLGTLLDTGKIFVTGPLSGDSVFYYEFYERTFTGKRDNSNGTGSNNSNTDRYIIFDCFSPFILKSVLVYADGAGNRTIELRDSSKTVLHSKTVLLDDGENRIGLDFPVMPGVDLQLGVGSKPDMYRSSSGLSYPYVVPGVLSINKSNITDSPTKYYYFFYDWEIEIPYPPGRMPYQVVTGTSNISAAFTADPIMPDLTQSHEVTFTDQTAGSTFWHWDFGDGMSSNEQNPVHHYSQAGETTVMLVAGDTTGCTDTATLHLEITGNVGITNQDAITVFDVFPNPAKDDFSVKIELNKVEKVSLSLHDLSGKAIRHYHWHSGRIEETISLKGISPGLYLLRLQTASGSVSKKLAKL